MASIDTISHVSSNSMLAVQVTDFQIGPKPSSLPMPSIPESSDVILLRVTAAGLHNVVQARASGHHYSSVSLPHTPGVDGVGYEIMSPAINIVDTDRKYFYFSSLSVGKGSYVEYITLPRANVFPLPEGVDPLQCAALMNPVMSSWMALKGRVEFLRNANPAHGSQEAGFEVLILGATSISGRLAVRVARQFGATKVYGAARNERQLADLQGLDGRIRLNEASPNETNLPPAKIGDGVLDYLYGPWPAATLMSLGKLGARHPLIWVNIGSLGGEGVISSGELRSRDVTFRGAGIGAWDARELPGQTMGMLEVLRGVKEDAVKPCPAQDVEVGWKHERDRVVFTF